MRPISVLYIHPVGAFGGASRSLLEMIGAFPSGRVRPYVITPRGGVAALCKRKGIPTIETRGLSQFDNTRYGYYRGIRWLLLLREVCFLPFTLLAIVKARIRWSMVDAIHVNELTGISTVVLCKLIFRRPIVVHVRSVQECEKSPRRTSWINFVLRHFADAVVAIDQTVQRSLPRDLNVYVVHNGLAQSANTEPRGEPDTSNQSAGSNLLRVAMVGNLLKMKGVYDFVEAARLCIARNLNVEFLIVGSNTRDLKGVMGLLIKIAGFGRDVQADIDRMIREHRLEKRLRLLPFTLDVHEVYRSMDVLCFPSHLNAVGRPVLEAALSHIPGIVAITQPDSDTIIDGQTGICVEPRSPTALADAIEYFCRHPEEVRRMGEMAYKLAIEHFDIQKNALRILQIYEEHLIEHPPRTRCIGNGAAVDGRVSATSPGKRPVRF